jgi:hypothetical protein
LKNLVFDSSALISISLNHLTRILAELGEKQKVNFIIPDSVKKEIVDSPLKTKIFKLEAVMVNSILGTTLKLFKGMNLGAKASKLQSLANSTFIANGNPIHLVNLGEMEGLAAAILLKSPYVVDERTTKLLVENSENLKNLLERKLHTKITINRKNLDEFSKETREVTILRSSELMTVAYEKGLFDNCKNKGISNREILEGILWGLKLRGCAISFEEISEIITLERE